MEPEGRRFTYLDSKEWQVLFGLAAVSATLPDAKGKLRGRDAKTVGRAYNVACALHRRGIGPLNDDEATQIADTAKYEATSKYVRDAFLRYKDWTQRGEGALHEHLRRQKLLEHYEDIRHLVDGLIEVLPFGEPRYLNVLATSNILDAPKGALVDPFGGLPKLHWDLKDHRLRRTMPDGFELLIEHLRSSGQSAIIQELEDWAMLGGNCIQECCRLLEEIKREAEIATELKTVFSDSDRTPEPGLWKEFHQSLYVLALTDPFDFTYIPEVSRQGELRLLGTRGRLDQDGLYTLDWNLAWAPYRGITRIQDIHRDLTKQFRESSSAKEIAKIVVQMKGIDCKLAVGLTEFSSQLAIPGRCSQCPE